MRLQRYRLGLMAFALLVAALSVSGAHAQAAADCPPTAQPPTPERIQSGMRDAHDRGFLWRVTKAGHSSYLYGTVHVAQLDWMFPGPKVSKALLASDTVALELDLLDEDVRRRLTEGLAALGNGDLPDTLKQRLQRRFEAECIPAASMAGLGPEMQVATLAVLAGRREGLDPAFSIDVFLAGFGRGAAKTVVSLETPELQVQALHMPDRQAMLDFVSGGLDELDSGRTGASLKRIAQVWAEADHAELARYDEWCECRQTEVERAVMKRLLDDRNPALGKTIDALHAGGHRVFAAVGSLHMIGPLGLPALLAQRGYRVERIDFKP